MSATDSELASMEEPRGCEDEEGSPADLPSSVPPPAVPPSAPVVPTTTRPHFTGETVIETKAVSMASTSCSSALSSPAEASPAKPAVTPPTTFEGTVETSPATSRIASASDSLTSTGTTLVNISETQPPAPTLPPTTFGCPDPGTDFPAVLTFKGVSVTLENNSVWKQFNSCGTEMILTKQGRRMFPYCRYRLAGLDPDRRYSLVLSIVPSDQYRYRRSTSRWEVSGVGEHPGLIRAFSHHYSPCRGSDWMGALVSFYKLKLTNNPQDQDGHIVLHSMHRYVPRLHVIPVPDGNILSPEQPVALGPESMTFTFPQTEFMAVTTYQNFRITQLKINHNPFAKGFRDDGNSCRLNRVSPEAQPVVEIGAQSAAVPAGLNETQEKTDDQSPKNLTVSDSHPVVTRLVLKPIMSTSAGKGDPFVPCIRGNHALGELVLVQKPPKVEPADDSHVVSPATSTPASSPRYRRKRRRINRRWANSRGRDWKPATASPKVLHSPSTPAAVRPELDDVEGLLFVSFTSKEALEVHVREMPANNSPSASSVSPTTPVQLKQTDELPETHEKRIVSLEAVLLQDLQFLKHRQAIHPVLQAVGMKLSSLDAATSIDLRYLGVSLPLPSPKLPEQVKAGCPVDEGLPFISRTGKTSDMTKIKGWKNKFIRSTETSPSNSDGSQRNLSAFCSNMLDEYLESEAQAISERAAAFSTAPEASVAYQLPAKSSSYVKTLDSVLKHRNATSKSTAGANKPCPLSHKPSLYSALVAPAPPLATPARPVAPVQTGAQSIQRSELLVTQPGTSGSTHSSAVSQRLSTHLPAAGQRPAAGSGNSHGTANRLSGLTKCQLKLLQMENRAMNEGLSRTELTPERLSVALSVILTKQALYSHGLKIPQVPKQNDEEPACGQDFCRLGCVCSSLQHQSRGLLLCRRPDCMFGCDCFKRKISMQLTAGESDQPMQSFFSLADVEHVIKPRTGSQRKKLWDGAQDTDPEPLFAPRGGPPHEVHGKVPKRPSVPRPPQPIREEDKDPVYKYLESFMTCARVREFNSKPPPVLSEESTVFYGSAPDSSAKPQQSITETAAGNPPKHIYSSVTIVKKAAEKTSRETTSQEDQKIQIEIQSACDWSNDQKMVLEALCRRMSQNRLSKQFGIGPYRIRPVAKICIRKPSGSLVTYRVHIRKTLNASDDEEDELDDSDEEKYATSDEEEAETRCGVTPFLSGVLPAGRLRARTKPVGCQAFGLIQVNGKSYNQARLLLGNMGSLHPANRLAAYVTGRLKAPADDSLKNSQKSAPSNKINTVGSLRMKAAGSVVPPVITARRTTELKTSTQPPVQPFVKDLRRGSVNVPQPPQNSATIKPVQTFVPGQRSSLSLYQNSSRSSPVSLTVSPSLKTPSFLGKSGTYSFRICPPSNQSAGDQKQQGVALPGGFTLIELPKHGGEEATQQSESVTATTMAATGIAPHLKDALLNFGRYSAGVNVKWAGLDTFAQVKELLKSRRVNSQPSTQLCAEKMPSDDADEATGRQMETSQDMSSEEFSFDSSDDCGEDDEDDEMVDIETVEETRPGMAVVKTEETGERTLLESRNCSYDVGPGRQLSIQDHDDNKEDMKDTIRRKNHSVLERKRRSQQRHLFDRLQVVLKSNAGAPRLRLLSLALKEIQNLVETSRRLEEKKRRLLMMQAVYVKELSLLSGKPDKLIKDKLKDICERQKTRENTMTWRPFFSHLLQSKAALLQAITPESNVKPTLAPFQANKPTSAAQNGINLKPMPTPCSLPPAVASPAQVEVTAPSLTENQPDEPAASGRGDQPKCQVKVEAQQEVPVTLPQVSTSKSQTESQPQVLAVVAEQLIAAEGATSPESSTPSANSPFVAAPQPFALPLIRSKTGRIILPSSLKPLGQGFYTLMVMKPKQNEKDDDHESSATMQSSDVDTSKNPEKILSESSHPSQSESGPSLDKSAQSPKSEPNRSHVKAPLVELSRLNKSVVVPLLGNGQKGKVVNSNATQEVAFFLSNSVLVDASSVAPGLGPSPAEIRRSRGRPRKNPVTPRSENKKRSLGEDARLNVIKIRPKMDTDNPVPVKRRRGRPPKRKSARNLHSRAGSSPSRSSDDGPFRLPRVFKTPNTKPKESPSARHLTRGSLGKDFPSAKKRSWIDVEKELEPELDSE